jgi:hypothetical protein
VCQRSAPEWLDKAIMCMSLPDEALMRQPPWIKEEYQSRLVCSKEFTTLIDPDAKVMANTDFKGMVYSIY